jgi:hypothetical protein
MEPEKTWSDTFAETFLTQARTAVEYLPSLFAAILVLIAGWIVARLLRGALRKLALVANGYLERNFTSGPLAGARVSSLVATLLGEAVFWVIVLISVTVATRVAGFSTITVWLDRITTHLPNLVAGIAIVIIGYFLSVYAREELASRMQVARFKRSMDWARLFQLLVFSVALIVGLDQVGLEVTLIAALIVVCVATVLIGMLVAFAIGARTYVSNVIGVHAARGQLTAGMRIRINGVEGEILELTPTQVALNTDDGKVLVPGKFVDEQVTTILAREVLQGESDA